MNFLFHNNYFAINMNQEVSPVFLWLPATTEDLTSMENAENSIISQIEANYQAFYKLYLENQGLRNELSTIKQANLQLSQENESLQNQRNELSLREKRRYSKRRTWLEKLYSCSFEDCEGRYSSKIALNNHLRKKHCQEVE
jgi:regulator of replication initiation timing